MAGFAALYPPYGPLGLACVLGRIEPQAKSANRLPTDKKAGPGKPGAGTRSETLAKNQKANW
jgi:hypothetical protein